MSSTPSMSWTSQSSAPGRTGAKPTPQLPITTVVTPCQHVGVSSGSHVTWPSKCVWTSTKPGVTSAPSASTFSRANSLTRPTSVTTPSVIATSAVRPGAPVPSTTVPPLINRSCMSDQLSEERLDVGHQQVGLFERGEVAAAVEARVADDVEARLGKCPRDAEDLGGEHRGRGRDADVLAHRSEAVTARRLAVETRRRVDR